MENKIAPFTWASWVELCPSKRTLTILGVLAITSALVLLLSGNLFAAGGHLPGADESDKLEAAGTLLRLIDTGLFKWGARIFAGLCIMAAAWSLKEQRFGVCVICIVAAIIFGTAPTWVKNIFNMGGTDSIFSLNAPPSHTLVLPSSNGEVFNV